MNKILKAIQDWGLTLVSYNAGGDVTTVKIQEFENEIRGHSEEWMLDQITSRAEEVRLKIIRRSADRMLEKKWWHTPQSDKYGFRVVISDGKGSAWQGAYTSNRLAAARNAVHIMKVDLREKFVSRIQEEREFANVRFSEDDLTWIRVNCVVCQGQTFIESAEKHIKSISKTAEEKALKEPLKWEVRQTNIMEGRNRSFSRARVTVTNKVSLMGAVRLARSWFARTQENLNEAVLLRMYLDQTDSKLHRKE